MSNDTSPTPKRVRRFAIVGITNTVLDLGTYAMLRNLGLLIIVANFISTTIAFSFSFAANRRYTFQAHGEALHEQMLRFFPVTLAGSWVLQPILITGFTKLDGIFSGDFHILENHNVSILLPKVASAAIGLVWNYLWYHNYVFRRTDS